MKLKLFIIILVCFGSILTDDFNFSLDNIDETSLYKEINCNVGHTFKVYFEGEYLDTKPVIINKADALINFSINESRFKQSFRQSNGAVVRKGFAYYIFQCNRAGKFYLDIEITLNGNKNIMFDLGSPEEHKIFRFDVNVDI